MIDIIWFKHDDADEAQLNNEHNMVRFIETEGVCQFCGSTKDVDDFENVYARGQKANLMMCDDCMDKFAQAFIEKQLE